MSTNINSGTTTSPIIAIKHIFTFGCGSAEIAFKGDDKDIKALFMRGGNHTDNNGFYHSEVVESDRVETQEFFWPPCSGTVTPKEGFRWIEEIVASILEVPQAAVRRGECDKFMRGLVRAEEMVMRDKIPLHRQPVTDLIQ